MELVDALDALLPQTQCGECGYNGCKPYAQALAMGAATIDKCPPGGVETLKALGTLLHIDATPFMHKVKEGTRLPSIASIREAECIGCTKCIKACPVDAIIGSAKKMHAIITTDCTGCGLCVEPCPVDCIEMTPKPQASYDKTKARLQYQNKKVRELQEVLETQQAYRAKKQLRLEDSHQQDKLAKQDFIAAALARVKAKRSHE